MTRTNLFNDLINAINELSNLTSIINGTKITPKPSRKYLVNDKKSLKATINYFIKNRIEFEQFNSSLPKVFTNHLSNELNHISNLSKTAKTMNFTLNFIKKIFDLGKVVFESLKEFAPKELKAIFEILKESCESKSILIS